MTFTKRALGALAAGALALPFLASPALAAPGDTPTPPVRDISAFCSNPTSAQFSDVQSTDVFALAIRCIATAGITQGNPQGIGADKYGPLLEVTRGQMASFIARMIDAAVAREVDEDAIRELPAPAAANPFPGDVPNNNIHLDNIKRLAQARIVTGNPGTAQQPNGIGADRYGPELPVTRSQMASFINRAAAYMKNGDPAQAGTAGTGFSAPNAEFYVDAQQQVHVANVNGITSARIAEGVGGKRYNGLGNVTRAQMAGFLARTLATFFESDRSQVAGLSIVGLLEVFSANFPDNSRTAATRLAAGPGTGLTLRDYAATGLRAGVEYRITLIDANLVRRATDGTNSIFFTRDTTAAPTARGNFLTATGNPPAFFTSVNGQAPQNNDGTGNNRSNTTGSSVVVTPGADGVITFRIDASAPTRVIPVLYINGKAGNSLTAGGDSPRLEIDASGRPVELSQVARTSSRSA
jgi:hypothetical protein